MVEILMGETVSRTELKKKIDVLRQQGKKIVFTNGCFDILHIGHIRYLKQAKEMGDILVVGLNADISVTLLKPQRPVNPQEHRAEILSSLNMVDYIVIFEEETPKELITLLQPDVLVKGGDWKKEDIVGSDIAKETYSLPYIEGISTSEIIARIKNL